MIIFKEEEDLDLILEGKPWLFKKQLILFNRILELIEQIRIRLVKSPFWLKVDPCALECDRKNLMHTISLTFGRVIRAELKGEFGRIQVQLNVQKPLQQGIFILSDDRQKSWISFKYEKLSKFCFDVAI